MIFATVIEQVLKFFIPSRIYYKQAEVMSNWKCETRSHFLMRQVLATLSRL